MEQSQDMMSLKHQVILKRNRISLVNDLHITAISDHMIQNDVMSSEMIEKINAQDTRQEKTRMFLDQLACSGPHAFVSFKDSLIGSHDHLHEMLNREEDAPVKSREMLSLVESSAEINVPESTRVLLDMVETWQNSMARYIIKSHSRVAQLPWSKKTYPIDSAFIPVNLRKVSDEDCSYLDHYHHILDQTVENLEPKRILLKGRSGTGTTTLLKKLAYDWAMEINKNQNDLQPQRGLFGYEFLIPLSLKDVEKGMTIAQIIAHKNPFITEEDAKHLCDYLETNPQSVVFLIDDYDEYDLETSEEMTQMLSNEAHMKWCVVLATRPWKVSSIQNPEFIDTQIEILGLSRTGTEEFISTYFQGEADGAEIVDEIKEIATKQKLWDMMSYPVLTMFMCILGKTNKSLPSTLTDLYFEILKFLILTQIGEEVQSETKEHILSKYESVLMEIGKVAFFGNITQESSFHLNNTKQGLSEEAWKLGLLAGTEQEGENEMAEFPCQSIQDFLAAFYICKDEHWDTLFNTLRQRCNGLKAVYDLEYMIKFICGISPEKGNAILKHVNSLVKDSKYIKSDLSKPGPVKTSSITSSYYEYVNRLSEFLVGCSMQYKQRDMDFPVTALSTDLTPESLNLVSRLLENEHNMNNLEMLCLCRPVQQDDGFFKISYTKVIDCLRQSSRKFHTLCLYNVDCSEGIQDLALEITSKDNMTTLCLVKANLQPNHIKQIAETFGITCPGFEYLNLSGNQIQKSAEDIGSLLEFCPGMKGFSVSDSDISSADIVQLAVQIKNNCLDIECIDISQNTVESHFSEFIASLQNLPKLKHIKARECGIPSGCFESLVDATATCPSMKTLDVSWNPLGDEIHPVLSKKYGHFQNLTKLYMLALLISTDTLHAIENTVKSKLPNLKLHITQKLRVRNMSGVGLSDRNPEISLRRANSQLDIQEMVPEAEGEISDTEDCNLIKRSMSVHPGAQPTS